jgi:general secretion pathway protein D
MNKSQDDYKTLTDPIDFEEVESEIPPLIAQDIEDEIPEALMKEVSLNITKDVSIPKIFQKIAEQADISVLITKNVAGSLIYKTKGQPLYQAIENICEILNLRYTYKNGLLKIEKDLPYLETYDIQFLSISRKSQMNVSTNTQLFSKEQNKGISSNNGSSTKLDTIGENDFWEEIKLNLESILSSHLPVQIEHLQITEETEVPDKKENLQEKGIRRKPYFTLNKQSGLVSVFASKKQHREVESFINRLRRNTNSQILIEAKVVEVNLKEEFKSGIDWSSITKGDFTTNARLGSIAKISPTIISNPVTSSVTTIGIDGKDFSSILNLMESFGTTRTLSSPRLTVMNNQTALLKVAENHVFFAIEYDRHYLNNRTDTTNNGLIVASRSTIQSIPIGFVMAVQPAIDQDTEEIVINLRPTISRVIGTKADPSISIVNNSLNPGTNKIDSEVPVVAVREIDSVMKLKSGQVAILGGLMVEGSESVDAGVPGTKGGFFSFLTRAKRDAQSVTELVIFIKATIVNNNLISKADKRLYKQFTRDPRPI